MTPSFWLPTAPRRRRRHRGNGAVDQNVGFRAFPDTGDPVVVVGQKFTIAPVSKVGRTLDGAVVDACNGACIDHESASGLRTDDAALSDDDHDVRDPTEVATGNAAHRVPGDDAALFDFHVGAEDGARVYARDRAINVVGRSNAPAHRTADDDRQIRDGTGVVTEHTVQNVSARNGDRMINVVILAAEGTFEVVFRRTDGDIALRRTFTRDRNIRAEVKGDVFKGIAADVDVFGNGDHFLYRGDGGLDNRYFVLHAAVIRRRDQIAVCPVCKIAGRKHRFGDLLVLFKGLVPTHNGDDAIACEFDLVRAVVKGCRNHADTDDGHRVDAGVSYGANADGVHVRGGVHKRPNVLQKVGCVVRNGKTADSFQGIESGALRNHDHVGEDAFIIGYRARVTGVGNVEGVDLFLRVGIFTDGARKHDAEVDDLKVLINCY